ncbi:hypothetical protein TorRG33x02_261240, partial [Trema orientale]
RREKERGASAIVHPPSNRRSSSITCHPIGKRGRRRSSGSNPCQISSSNARKRSHRSFRQCWIRLIIAVIFRTVLAVISPPVRISLFWPFY